MDIPLEVGEDILTPYLDLESLYRLSQVDRRYLVALTQRVESLLSDGSDEPYWLALEMHDLDLLSRIVEYPEAYIGLSDDVLISYIESGWREGVRLIAGIDLDAFFEFLDEWLPIQVDLTPVVNTLDRLIVEYLVSPASMGRVGILDELWGELDLSRILDIAIDNQMDITPIAYRILDDLHQRYKWSGDLREDTRWMLSNPSIQSPDRRTLERILNNQ